MRHIVRDHEPQLWSDCKKRNVNDRYVDLNLTEAGRRARQEMRKHLVGTQYGICAYCCSRISADSESSHIEHIKPESLFQNETMDYSNLVASCNNSNTCGSSKGGLYSDELVSPLEDDCAVHFKFYPNGKVVGVDSRGKYTCDLLQLNCYRLQNARRAMFESLNWADEDYIRTYFLTPDTDGNLAQFADMLEQMCEEGFFPKKADDVSGD